ncbi:MAG: hypothetical protein U5K74_09435 [Gemmatimonadaceae bacterium]|nr:hypothetical protein [Gemmatimonadaceae bacterium]
MHHEPNWPGASRVGVSGPYRPITPPTEPATLEVLMESLSHTEDLATPSETTGLRSVVRSGRVSRVGRLAGLVVAAAAMLSACKGSDSSTGPAAVTERRSLVPSTQNTILEFAGSQVVSSGSPAPSQIFDDFTFTAASTIRTASWQGAYCVATSNTTSPTATATAFRVSIYADAGGRPQLATPLAQATYPIAQTAQTLELNIPGLTCNDGFGRQGTNVTFGTYRYQVTLATPFAAAANTKYWFSVQAVTPTYGSLWGWRDGVNDNNTSLRYFNGVFQATSPYDRAFSLTP